MVARAFHRDVVKLSFYSDAAGAVFHLDFGDDEGLDGRDAVLGNAFE